MKKLFNKFLKIALIVTIQFTFSNCNLIEMLFNPNSETKPDSSTDLTNDGLSANMTKPVKVFILMGQSNMLGAGAVEPDGNEGTLANATKSKGMYQHLLDADGDWTVRKDVRNTFVMRSGTSPWQEKKNDWLTAADTNGIGPELQFGYIMGHFFDEPVLILKSCIGNRSLGWDLLPPDSVQYEHDGYTYAGFGDSPMKWLTGTTPTPIGWTAGIQYEGDTTAAQDVLDALGTYYPGATQYEIAGFVFWQGDKDRYDAGLASRYEPNLVNLIKALRSDFNAPNAPFVCATLGQTEKGATGNEGLILDAQLAVDGDTGKYPEFAGNVATVYSHPLSMGGSSSGHYNGNAETYMNVGNALGLAMVKLLGGADGNNNDNNNNNNNNQTATTAEIMKFCSTSNPGASFNVMHEEEGLYTSDAGSRVKVTYCNSFAGYTSDLILDSPESIFITNNLLDPDGTTLDLGVLNGGNELIFAIKVQSTGYTYFTGDASRNPDELAHAQLFEIKSNIFLIRFEDYFGGGDKDYNDMNFIVQIFDK